MQTRLHKKYDCGDEIYAIRYGLACLKRDGITAESMIDQFSNKIKRIALEMDMGAVTTMHTPLESDHPYLFAAEYFLEEMLSYPLLPEKYGIKIKLPDAFVAYRAIREENGYNHGAINFTGDNAVSLLKNSDDYMMAALIEGFDSSVRTVQKASPEAVYMLACKNPLALSQLNPELIPETIWMQAIITNAATITFLPDSYDRIKFLEIACAVKSNALNKIEIQDADFLPKLMAQSNDYRQTIIKLAKTQCGGLIGICMLCNDKDFLEIASINPEVLRDKENIKHRSTEVCYQLIEIHKYDVDLHHWMAEYMPITALERALDKGILDIQDMPKERAELFGKKYSAKVKSNGRDDDWDNIPF